MGNAEEEERASEKGSNRGQGRGDSIDGTGKGKEVQR